MMKHKHPSTSDGSVKLADIVENVIHKIKDTMKISVSLKKMKKKTSVEFLTKEMVTLESLCKFYLEEGKLDIPSTEETESIVKKISFALEYVEAHELLGEIKDDFNELKKLEFAIIREMLQQVPKEEIISTELRALKARMEIADQKSCDSVSRFHLSLRTIKRQANNTLAFANVCQNVMALPDYEDSEEILETCASRKEMARNAIKIADNAQEQVEKLWGGFKTRVRIDDFKTKEFENKLPGEMMKNVEKVKKDVSKFNLKIQTKDPKGLVYLGAFRMYVADVKLLISYYAEAAKKHKQGLGELLDAYYDFNSVRKTNELGRRKATATLEKLQKTNAKMEELGIVVHETKQTVEENCINAGGTEHERVLIF
ncbi:unnamed protein product [Caenorhabditis nigoni]